MQNKQNVREEASTDFIGSTFIIMRHKKVALAFAHWHCSFCSSIAICSLRKLRKLRLITIGSNWRRSEKEKVEKLSFLTGIIHLSLYVGSSKLEIEERNHL